MKHPAPAASDQHFPKARSRLPGWGAALCGLLAVAGGIAPSSARAQQNAGTEATNLDVARSVAVSGREAFNAGDYETALALFRKAYELYPAPTVVLYEARTLEKMGLLLEAVEAYSRTTQRTVPTNAPAQFAEAMAAAREEGDALAARVPTLILVLRGVRPDDPTLSVTLDGRALDAAQLQQAQRVNPGTHRVVGTASVDRRFSSDVTLIPGQSRRVVINLTAASSDPLDDERPVATSAVLDDAPSSSRSIPWLTYVAGGIGVAGVGAGVITGLLANAKYDEAERLCQDHRCAPGTPGLDAVDAFRTWRMVSSVSYGVGAAGIAAGVVLWLTASGDEEAGHAGSIELWGTAKTAGVRGTF